MSESLNDVTFDLEFEDTLTHLEEQPEEFDSPSDFQNLQERQHLQDHPVPIRSISNSPGCAPGSLSTSGSASRSMLRPVRRPRSVRVDAWAVPASANWSRSRNPMRKVKRVSRSTDWALPF